MSENRESKIGGGREGYGEEKKWEKEGRGEGRRE